jgi:hypothetical protein
MRSWRGPCGGHTSQATGSMGRDSSGRATRGYATPEPHRVGCRAFVRPLVIHGLHVFVLRSSGFRNSGDPHFGHRYIS